MIRYALRCSQNHRFESWFANAEAYDRLTETGQIVCPDCGATSVVKAPMAPGVASGGKEEHPLAKLRRRVETSSDDMGRAFATEARAIAAGTARDRPIHGEATGAEARKLISDGIPVVPLPFKPKSKLS